MYMDKILMTVLISMAPVAELRAAIPFLARWYAPVPNRNVIFAFIFFVILVIACYQFLYFLSDMFLLGYINKYSWNLNFIQGTLNFLSIFLPYVFVRRIFRKTNQEKEDANN